MFAIIQCIPFALATTLFYKKNLNKLHLPMVMLCILIGLCTHLLIEGEFTLTVTSAAVTYALYCAYGTDHGWLKSAAKLDIFIAFFLAIIEVKFDISQNGVEQFTSMMSPIVVNKTQFFHQWCYEDICEYNKTQVLRQEEVHGIALTLWSYITSSRGISTIVSLLSGLCRLLPQWHVLRIVLIALPQFIRHPVSLKAKLQGLRSKLGPMYVLFIASYTWELFQQRQTEHVFRVVAWIVIAIGSAFAGVLTRPDNATMCEIFGLPSSYRCRKLCHKISMIGSFVCVLVLTIC